MPSLSSTASEFPDHAGWPSPDGSRHDLLPTRTHAWMRARADILGVGEIIMFAVRSAGRTTALAPLMLEAEWLLELPDLFEPSDLVWSTPESLDALAALLSRQPRPVLLERIPERSPSIDALRRAFRWRGIVLVSNAMPTPMIDLAGHGEDPDACLSTRGRSDLRRAERRARSLGKMEYEIHAPGSEEEMIALMAEALAVEARSWKAGAGTALTADPRQGRFFGTFVREAQREGMLRIAFLRIDGRAVAMQIAGEWNRRFWLFKISHDQDFAECSPGQLLILHTLRHAARRGLLSYEFMGIMAPWTAQWTRTLRHYKDVRAIPFTTSACRILAKGVLRRAYARLRRFVS